MNSLTIRSSQKVFTEEEVSGLTGICPEHLRNMARSRRLGYLVPVQRVDGDGAGSWFFTNSDVMVLTALHPRCEH